MKSEDRELAAWKEEWQALGGREGLADELATRAARDERRIRRGIVGELLAVALSTSLGAWLVVKTGGSALVLVMVAVILVFNGVWITRLLTLREGEARGLAEGVDGFIALARRRADDDMRWNRFARRAIGVLAALVVPWSIWAASAHREAYVREPWRAVVGFGLAFAILAGTALWNERRRRGLVGERARLERLVAERTLPLDVETDGATSS